jgi:hypothetical protein
MASESMEIITMAIDKHQATKNYEVYFSSSTLFHQNISYDMSEVSMPV